MPELMRARHALVALLACLPLTAAAAPTFFWRAEGTTLDGTHDFTAGDSTATGNGGVSISGTAAKVGSNGVLTTNDLDYYSFASASIASKSVGSMGGWVQWKTAVPAAGTSNVVVLRNTGDANDELGIEPRASQEFGCRIRQSGGSNLVIETTGVNAAVDTWYYVICRWNISADDRRIEVYNSSGTLIEAVEDLTTDLAGAEPGTIDEIRVGNVGSNANAVWYDQIIISQAYGEPIELNLATTSYSSYDSGGCSGTPAISDVDSDESVTATQANVVITLTGGCSPQGSGTVTLRQSGNVKTLSVDSWSATSIQVDMSGVGMGVVNGLLYGSMDIRVTNDASNFDDQAITVTAPSGTKYGTLSGGLAVLAFDGNDNATRLFGDPLDLQTTSQVALRNASGCTISTDIIINANGSISAAEACVQADWDFSRDGLYLGSVATVAWSGCPPRFEGEFGDLVFQEDLAIAGLDVAAFFEPCDETIDTFSMQVLGAAVDSTTDVNGAVTSGTLLVVDDASVLLDDVGKYIQCGAGGAPARLRWANPLTNEILVSVAVTCADNAQVNVRTPSGTSVPGLTFDSGTGVLSGTPSTAGVTGPIVFRGATASGLTVDTP